MAGEDAHVAILAGDLGVVGALADYEFLGRRDFDLEVGLQQAKSAALPLIELHGEVGGSPGAV